MFHLLRISAIVILCCVAIGTILGKTPANTSTQQGTVIIVNERARVGPNRAAQLRVGRLFLPIFPVAQALGHTLSSDATLRLVTVRRQNGASAVFNAALNEVR